MMAVDPQQKNLKRTIAQTLTSFDSANPLIDLYVRFHCPDLHSKYVLVELSTILLENCKVSYEHRRRLWGHPRRAPPPNNRKTPMHFVTFYHFPPIFGLPTQYF